jgi:hypothetical protein
MLVSIGSSIPIGLAESFIGPFQRYHSCEITDVSLMFGCFHHSTHRYILEFEVLAGQKFLEHELKFLPLMRNSTRDVDPPILASALAQPHVVSISVTISDVDPVVAERTARSVQGDILISDVPHIEIAVSPVV